MYSVQPCTQHAGRSRRSIGSQRPRATLPAPLCSITSHCRCLMQHRSTVHVTCVHHAAVHCCCRFYLSHFNPLTTSTRVDEDVPSSFDTALPYCRSALRRRGRLHCLRTLDSALRSAEQSQMPLPSSSTSLFAILPTLQTRRSLRLSALELFQVVQAGVRFPRVQRLEVLGCLPAGLQDCFFHCRFHVLGSFPSLRHLALSGGRMAPRFPLWDLAGWDQLRSVRVHALYGDPTLWQAWGGVRRLVLDLDGLSTDDELRNGRQPKTRSSSELRLSQLPSAIGVSSAPPPTSLPLPHMRYSTVP